MQLTLFSLYPNIFNPCYGKCYETCKNFTYCKNIGCIYPELMSDTDGSAFYLNTNLDDVIEMRCKYYNG